MLISFVFYKDHSGTIRVDYDNAETVKGIFQLYLHGFGLKRITVHLAEKPMLPLTGKDKWTDSIRFSVLQRGNTVFFRKQMDKVACIIKAYFKCNLRDGKIRFLEELFGILQL